MPNLKPGGRNDKYAGLEDLDVGSKFRMFERTSASPERPEPRGPASDRFGIMEKLKRLQVSKAFASGDPKLRTDPYLTKSELVVLHLPPLTVFELGEILDVHFVPLLNKTFDGNHSGDLN
jgi:hypothetical protein